MNERRLTAEHYSNPLVYHWIKLILATSFPLEWLHECPVCMSFLDWRNRPGSNRFALLLPGPPLGCSVWAHAWRVACRLSGLTAFVELSHEGLVGQTGIEPATSSSQS